MATWTSALPRPPHDDRAATKPRVPTIIAAVSCALALVVLTRWPVARTVPLETDEFGFLEDVAVQWFPMHHTLFKTLARGLGLLAGDFYRGFIVLDMIASALAMASAWWWLRALVRPAVAAAAALMLGVGPVFWGYGAIAGNYTAIIVVGSFLLGIAVRGRHEPEPWQPFAAAAVLAGGTGYRPDIGLFWLPVFLVILWQHRWRRAVLAGIVFGVLNLAWSGAMIVEAGGWERYREATAQFAHNAGALNSYWNLGFIDGPVRYAVKMGMALVWTLGPALLVRAPGRGPAPWPRRRRIPGVPHHPQHRPGAGVPPADPLRRSRLLFPLRPGGAGAGRRGDRTRWPAGGLARARRRAERRRSRRAAADRAGGDPGGRLLVLPDGLLRSGLARGFRPRILPAHPQRPERTRAQAGTVPVADGQFPNDFRPESLERGCSPGLRLGRRIRGPGDGPRPAVAAAGCRRHAAARRRDAGLEPAVGRIGRCPLDPPRGGALVESHQRTGDQRDRRSHDEGIRSPELARDLDAIGPQSAQDMHGHVGDILVADHLHHGAGGAPDVVGTNGPPGDVGDRRGRDAGRAGAQAGVELSPGVREDDRRGGERRRQLAEHQERLGQGQDRLHLPGHLLLLDGHRDRRADRDAPPVDRHDRPEARRVGELHEDRPLEDVLSGTNRHVEDAARERGPDRAPVVGRSRQLDPGLGRLDLARAVSLIVPLTPTTAETCFSLTSASAIRNRAFASVGSSWTSSCDSRTALPRRASTLRTSPSNGAMIFTRRAGSRTAVTW